MSRADPESISSGMSLPVWMRPRVEKTDIDGISFSPPPHEESFFYIRYPIAQSSADTAKRGLKGLSSVLEEGRAKQYQLQRKQQQVDYSKHTEPCKRFLNSTDSVTSPVDGVKNPPKSFGTDDGFKGPSAACGSSIVKVAQQMVSGRSFTSRGFKVATLDQPYTDSEKPSYTKTIEDQQIPTSKLIQADLSSEPETLSSIESTQILQSSSLSIRRGSKSLPSSPLGSPKSMRRYQNPFFTGSFVVTPVNNHEARGGFLSSLLGIQRETIPAHSDSHIAEESADAIDTYSHTESGKYVNQKILKAKPSELREMNFWSPTSM